MCHAFQKINSICVWSNWGRVCLVRGEVRLAVSIGFALFDSVSIGLFYMENMCIIKRDGIGFLSVGITAGLILVHRPC